jgi:sphingomyelin synthase-related protein 1
MIIKCLILFVLATLFYFNSYFLDVKSEKKFASKKTNIYDILHECLPHMPQFEFYSDILVGFTFCLMMIYSLIYSSDYSILYKFSGLWITIMIIRMFTINLTVLPKNKYCKINETNLLRGGCYDKIFSGHYASSFLMTILLKEYSVINNLVFFLINFFNGIVIILSRNHYTVDIVVSIIVVLFIYTNYLNFFDILDRII